MTIDRSAPDWPYQQVAATLRTRISDGVYGAKMPSHMHLADELGVAPRTVARALDVLKAEGLIETRPGRGTFIR